ncbi:hypothetical protein GCM10027610_090190 [Dactylosporangium cerinum]
MNSTSPIPTNCAGPRRGSPGCIAHPFDSHRLGTAGRGAADQAWPSARSRRKSPDGGNRRAHHRLRLFDRLPWCAPPSTPDAPPFSAGLRHPARRRSAPVNADRSGGIAWATDRGPADANRLERLLTLLTDSLRRR